MIHQPHTTMFGGIRARSGENPPESSVALLLSSPIFASLLFMGYSIFILAMLESYLKKDCGNNVFIFYVARGIYSVILLIYSFLAEYYNTPNHTNRLWADIFLIMVYIVPSSTLAPFLMCKNSDSTAGTFVIIEYLLSLIVMIPCLCYSIMLLVSFCTLCCPPDEVLATVERPLAEINLSSPGVNHAPLDPPSSG